MKSMYVYEDPKDLIRESYKTMKKVLKETSARIMMDFPSEKDEDVSMNHIASEVIKAIEKGMPEIQEEMKHAD